MSCRLHILDLLRKKRDGHALDDREIAFLVAGATDGSIAPEQLSAWLMASCIHGLSADETRALTLAMRDSGDRFDASRLGKIAVDKHSSGGVGDKTSFLVAPMVAACGLLVPMISGRSLGHTGGTLDKLESIPGYRTNLSLAEFESVLRLCGASIIGQTPTLVPADRNLYALRDRTGTVENTGLLCSSILSKKLAEGLSGLVLDVKTGSGSSLRDRRKSEHLAALMVSIAEAAGTRTVAVLSDMDQPLGRTAGNWIEVAECVELLRGHRPHQSEDLRELSLELAGWMIYLAGKVPEPEFGRQMAEATLEDGSALATFFKMVDAQGGELGVFDDPGAHRPGATQILEAWQRGVITAMDTTEIGRAVQHTGAGRLKPSDRVDPHAGIEFHHRRGARVRQGEPIATLYATTAAHLEEPLRRLKAAIHISPEPPRIEQALVGMVIDRETAEAVLGNADKVGKTATSL